MNTGESEIVREGKYLDFAQKVMYMMQLETGFDDFKMQRLLDLKYHTFTQWKNRGRLLYEIEQKAKARKKNN